ncbi:hypothetical protein WJX72_005692 [[Myrmecia] bisecta]|uniref:AP2/ERF domain-containing protein n=1 Tax=[Myrmecia] bisecta TaxID=41462 RepID=A0AAW1Q499_9CHLO
MVLGILQYTLVFHTAAQTSIINAGLGPGSSRRSHGGGDGGAVEFRLGTGGVNKSRYRGVSYDKKKRKWRVQIKVATLGKSGVSVGYYDTEQAAAKAYDRAAIGLLGRDNLSITTNFPLSDYDDESVPQLIGKTREEVKATLKSERAKVPRRRFTSRQRTSKFMGVGSSNRKNQWQARILVHGKVTHLGYYETEEEAARVYDRVSISLHGELAQTNFPPESYADDGACDEFSGLGREELQRALGVKPMDKSSRYRGVSKKKGKWEAKVMVNRKWAYRELFDSEEEAARAYDQAVWRLKPKEAKSYVNFKDKPNGRQRRSERAQSSRTTSSSDVHSSPSSSRSLPPLAPTSAAQLQASDLGPGSASTSLPHNLRRSTLQKLQQASKPISRASSASHLTTLGAGAEAQQAQRAEQGFGSFSDQGLDIFGDGPPTSSSYMGQPPKHPHGTRRMSRVMSEPDMQPALSGSSASSLQLGSSSPMLQFGYQSSLPQVSKGMFYQGGYKPMTSLPGGLRHSASYSELSSGGFMPSTLPMTSFPRRDAMQTGRGSNMMVRVGSETHFITESSMQSPRVGGMPRVATEPQFAHAMLQRPPALQRLTSESIMGQSGSDLLAWSPSRELPMRQGDLSDMQVDAPGNMFQFSSPSANGFDMPGSMAGNMLRSASAAHLSTSGWVPTGHHHSLASPGPSHSMGRSASTSNLLAMQGSNFGSLRSVLTCHQTTSPHRSPDGHGASDQQLSDDSNVRSLSAGTQRSPDGRALSHSLSPQHAQQLSSQRAQQPGQQRHQAGSSPADLLGDLSSSHLLHATELHSYNLPLQIVQIGGEELHSMFDHSADSDNEFLLESEILSPPHAA